MVLNWGGGSNVYESKNFSTFQNDFSIFFLPDYFEANSRHPIIYPLLFQFISLKDNPFKKHNNSVITPQNFYLFIYFWERKSCCEQKGRTGRENPEQVPHSVKERDVRLYPRDLGS